MKTLVLVAFAILVLGAGRAKLAPDAPTKGIGYHGSAGHSGR